jgi:hypothetical protein
VDVDNPRTADEATAYLQQLRARVENHVYATETDVALARLSAERSASSSQSMVSAIVELEALVAELEARLYKRIDSERDAADGPTRTQWDRLFIEIRDAEEKWQRLASIHKLNVDPPGIALLGGVMAAVFFHSFFVLRIHQQARQAAERLTEKRVGLFFLRLAFERPAPDAIATHLVEAGTQMFLGHQASPTLPLSSDDINSVHLPNF